jgi:hypothetical protein
MESCLRALRDLEDGTALIRRSADVALHHPDPAMRWRATIYFASIEIILLEVPGHVALSEQRQALEDLYGVETLASAALGELAECTFDEDEFE